jgi:outer membrane autotransporter protein
MIKLSSEMNGSNEVVIDSFVPRAPSCIASRLCCRVEIGNVFAKTWGLTMQPIRNAQSENRRPRSVEFPNKRRAAIGLNAEMKRVIWDARNENSPAASKASPAVSRMLSLLCFVAALAAWSPASFAQRQAITVGVTPLNADGSANGVDMTGAAFLDVGPAPLPTDIFTTNTSLTSLVPAVSTAANSTGNVVFLGSSNVYGAIGMLEPGGPYLLGVYGGANGATVNFLGPVYDTTTYVSGTGTLNFTALVNQSPGGLIYNGDGTVVLAAGVSLDAVGGVTTTAGTDTGTLVLGGGSSLDGAVGAGSAALRNVTVAGGSNAAGVSALITGAVNVYSFSLATNTLNVTGALTIADSTANGVINTTLASPSLYGNIRPVGTTNLGTSLMVNVAVPSGAIIPVGTTFYIVKTNGSQTGTPATIVNVLDPTNPNARFTGLDFGQGLIEVTNGTAFLGTTPITPPPGSPPGTPPVSPLPPGVPNPIVPSAPDVVAPVVTFQATRQFENLWLSHLDDVMCGQVGQPRQPGEQQPSSCQRNAPYSGWWLKGFGYFGNQGAQDGFTGYNSTILGTMIGVDAPVDALAFGGVTRVGFGIGYARTTINGKTVSADTDSNTYAATAYIAHEQGPWFVDGDLSFGWNDYSASRNILVPGTIDTTAQGGYNGQTYTAFVTTGYHFFPGGFTITPLASLQYTHMNLDGYTETGAAPLNLSVNSQSYDFLESALGVTAARAFSSDNGTYVPEVHFKWYHELINPRIQNTWAALAFTGSESFTTQGPKTAADTLNPGVGLTFLSCACTAKTWSLEGVYDYYWSANNYSANQFMIRFTGRF